MQSRRHRRGPEKEPTQGAGAPEAGEGRMGGSWGRDSATDGWDMGTGHREWLGGAGRLPVASTDMVCRPGTAGSVWVSAWMGHVGAPLASLKWDSTFLRGPQTQRWGPGLKERPGTFPVTRKPLSAPACPSNQHNLNMTIGVLLPSLKDA